MYGVRSTESMHAQNPYLIHITPPSTLRSVVVFHFHFKVIMVSCCLLSAANPLKDDPSCSP